MKQHFYCVDVNTKQLHFKFVSLGVDWNKTRVDFRCKLLDFLNRSIDDVNKKQLHFKFVSLGVDWNKNRVHFIYKLLDSLK